MEHHAHETITLWTYLSHFGAGLIFAASGAYASQFCKHLSHRIIIAVLLVALETIVVVSTIG